VTSGLARAPPNWQWRTIREEFSVCVPATVRIPLLPEFVDATIWSRSSSFARSGRRCPWRLGHSAGRAHRAAGPWQPSGRMSRGSCLGHDAAVTIPSRCPPAV